MIIPNNQPGSFPTGLLFVSAVFVALLVYASFFAFKQAGSKATVAVNGNQVGTGLTPSSVLAPLPGGIFESETVLNELDEVTAQSAASTGDKNNLSVVNEPKTLTEQAARESSPDTAQRATASSSNMNGHYPYFRSADAPRLTHSDQSLSRLANQQYHHAFSDGRSQGRGKGNMNSNGAFSFSLNFKTRARMNAESRGATDLADHLSTQNYAATRYWNTLGPSYRYHYQGYK